MCVLYMGAYYTGVNTVGGGVGNKRWATLWVFWGTLRGFHVASKTDMNGSMPLNENL